MMGAYKSLGGKHADNKMFDNHSVEYFSVLFEWNAGKKSGEGFYEQGRDAFDGIFCLLWFVSNRRVAIDFYAEAIVSFGTGMVDTAGCFIWGRDLFYYKKARNKTEIKSGK